MGKGTNTPPPDNKASAATAASEARTIKAFNDIVKALEPLDDKQRARVIKSAMCLYGLDHMLSDSWR